LSQADPAKPDPAAVACLDALRARGETVSTAESLTAGLACATLATVPGASDCLRGGLAAYVTDVKASVLGVDAALIEQYGAVSAQCAAAMAHAARVLFASDWAVATTGVAGPAEQEGQPVGTVFVAAATPHDVAVTRELSLAGSRDDVRRGAVRAALDLLLEQAVEPAVEHAVERSGPTRRAAPDLPVDQG
jgi:nicotinamide-nucleotide amidase